MNLLRCLTVGLPVVLLLSGCRRNGDPVAAAQTFFQQIGGGNAPAAYESSAFAFRAQQTLKIFEQASKEMGLPDFSSATWEQPEINGKTAKLRGEIVTKTDRKIPLIVMLVYESGAWRLCSLRPPRDVRTGLSENRFSLFGKGTRFTDVVNQPVPDEKVLKQLALETLLLFNDAIRQKSFADFYENIAGPWQKQLTIRRLQEAFQPFIDKEINIASIKDVEPVFNSPSEVTTDGLLSMTGYYPTKPYRVNFALKYLYELPKWRLFGIDVSLQK